MRTDYDLAFADDSQMGLIFPIEQAPGVSHSGHERNHLFMNMGGERYMDLSPLSGLDDQTDGRAFALLDYDRDGWQDLAVVNANAPLLRLYRNRIGERAGAGERGNMVALRFVGGNQTAQPISGFTVRDGYGAKIRATMGDVLLFREFRAGEGLASQNSEIMILGIGEKRLIDRLEVEWPSGERDVATGVGSGQLVTIYEDPSHSPTGEPFVQRPYGKASSLAGARDPGRRPLARLRLTNRAGNPPKLTMYTTMATWCPKCKGELPQLEILRRAFDEDQLEMNGVPIDPEDTAVMLSQYRDEYGPAYDLLDDLSRGDVMAVEKVVEHTTQLPDALPATLITDENGMVLYSTAGVPSVSDIKKLLQELEQ